MSNLVASNVSQALFNENEKLVGTIGSNIQQKGLQQFSFLGNINPIFANDSNMKSQTPAFLEQSRMSTYYQDNPWDILTYSKKFDGGIPVMGGPINPTQSPGYKPGNTYQNFSKGVEYFGNDKTPCRSTYYIGIIILVILLLAAAYYFSKK